MPLSFLQHWSGRGLGLRFIYKLWTVIQWEAHWDNVIWDLTR